MGSAGPREAAARLGGPAAAVSIAATVAVLGTAVIDRLNMPAFGNSNVLHTLTTVAQVVTLAVALTPAWLHLAGRTAPRLGLAAASAGVAGLVTVTLGLPLAATRLYLHGISVDQAFRTELLTRLTDSPRLADMAYADLPSYYPAGWFWLGGRYAALTGQPGWEAFKPWSILSLSVAAALAAALWMRQLGAARGGVVATVATAFVLAYGSPEPYGAAVALLAGPALLLLWASIRGGGRGRLAGGALLLGASAATYTLYTGVLALAAVTMAVVATGAAWRAGRADLRGRAAPLVRLAVVAVVSGLVALTVWAPYVLAATAGRPASAGTATHYLPDAGTRLPLPMFRLDLVGALCLAGLVWLLVRAGNDRVAQALGLGVVAGYLWMLGSMVVTLTGTTLLGFRVEVFATLLLLLAGALAIIDAVGALRGRTASGLPAWEARRRRLRTTAVGATLAVLAGVAFVQDIPDVLDTEIRIAYSDTDGAGARADRFPAGAAGHFGAVDAAIAAGTGRPVADTVVLTTEYELLATRPYRAFQAISSHYANPLGEYPARNAAIESWAALPGPAELAAALDALPWRGPDAFVFRGDDHTYRLRLSSDVYPNDPNVHRHTVEFPARLFAGPEFTARRVGPFVVVTRAT